MRQSFIAGAILLGVLTAAPAYAQSAQSTTKQNAAEAGGSIGTVGNSATAAKPQAGTEMIPTTNPNASHTGVSGEAAAAGGAR